jgi:phosphinothricin acetyltransferase
MAELLARLGADGYVMAFAAIALPNPVSERLHESLGFLPVGVFRDVGFKHGGWRDVAWWSRQLRMPPEEPEEPVVHTR